MRYIRRIDSPSIIKSYGDVPPGGLGEFDPATYEEVEGELPTKKVKGKIVPNFEMEVLPSKSSLLKQAFDSQPIEFQLLFASSLTLVRYYQDSDEWDKIKEVIQKTPIPDEHPQKLEFESLKTQMVSLIS